MRLFRLRDVSNVDESRNEKRLCGWFSCSQCEVIFELGHESIPRIFEHESSVYIQGCFVIQRGLQVERGVWQGVRDVNGSESIKTVHPCHREKTRYPQGRCV